MIGALHGVAIANFTTNFEGFNMELLDRIFTVNRDWDPTYLRYVFSQDFYEFRELWNNNTGDHELVREVEKSERYSPIVEDISLDDDTLYNAVAQIEEQ